MFGGPKHGSARRVAVLRSVPAFAGLPDDLLKRLDSLLYETVLPSGTELMVEGEPGRQAFVIAGGTAEVRVGDQVVAHVRSGDLAGELALLEDLPRSATVRAITPLHVFVMGPRQFRALFEDSRLGLWIAANLAKRLRASNARTFAAAPAQLLS
jgi:CRP-like cAMP-binding protein